MPTMIEYGDDRLVAETAMKDPEPGLEVLRRMFGIAVWGAHGLPRDDRMRETIEVVPTGVELR
jgi:hypothetical protein